MRSVDQAAWPLAGQRYTIQAATRALVSSADSSVTFLVSLTLPKDRRLWILKILYVFAPIELRRLTRIRFGLMISVLVSLFLSVRSWLQSRTELQLELLALRHQLYVLNRSRP